MSSSRSRDRTSTIRKEQDAADEKILIEKHGLPLVGSRVRAEFPGFPNLTLTGTIESVGPNWELPGNEDYLLRLRTDDGDLYILTGSDGFVIRSEVTADGVGAAPGKFKLAHDVGADAPPNVSANPSDPRNSPKKNEVQHSQKVRDREMLRYLISLLVVSGLGYWAYSSWENHLEAERQQQAVAARQQSMKTSMIEMASKANAITDWATTLADRKRLRNSQVLTAELQKQWLNGRPIFFLGNLKDIAINSDGTYQMDVEYNWLGGQPIFAQNDIRMSLRCPELIALPMVLAAKARPSAILHSDTAVVAVIDHIVSTAESDASGEKTTALTGVGKCLAAMSLTERVSWP